MGRRESPPRRRAAEKGRQGPMPPSCPPSSSSCVSFWQQPWKGQPGQYRRSRNRTWPSDSVLRPGVTCRPRALQTGRAGGRRYRRGRWRPRQHTVSTEHGAGFWTQTFGCCSSDSFRRWPGPCALEPPFFCWKSGTKLYHESSYMLRVDSGARSLPLEYALEVSTSTAGQGREVRGFRYRIHSSFRLWGPTAGCAGNGRDARA